MFTFTSRTNRCAMQSLFIFLALMGIAVQEADAQITFRASGRAMKVPVNYGGHYALIVDSYSYKYWQLDEEEKVIERRNDRLQKSLTESGFTVVRCSNPRSHQLKRVFDDFFRTYGDRGNCLLVYLDGKSFHDPFFGETYFLPYEAPTKTRDRKFYDSLLTLSDLLKSAKRVTRGHALIMLNSLTPDTRLKSKDTEPRKFAMRLAAAHSVCEFISAGKSPGKQFHDTLVAGWTNKKALARNGQMITGHSLGNYFLNQRDCDFQYRGDQSGTLMFQVNGQKEDERDKDDKDDDEAEERRERIREWVRERDRENNDRSDKDDREHDKKIEDRPIRRPVTKPVSKPVPRKLTYTEEVVLKMDGFEKQIQSLLDAGYRQTSSTVNKVRESRDQYLLAQGARVERELRSAQEAYTLLLREMHEYAAPVVQMKKSMDQLRELDLRIKRLTRVTLIESLLDQIRVHHGRRNDKEGLKACDELLKYDPGHRDALAWRALFLKRMRAQRLRPVTNRIGMKLAYIPSGKFTMGSPATEAGREDVETIREVTISKPFYMGTTEVTQGQWAKVMGTTMMQRQGTYRPWIFKGVGDNYPMYYVSWHEANEFCRRLSMKESKKYRLPTEAEWEYACRADTTGPWAGILSELGWFKSNATASTNPVAQKKSNDWGLFDMHGNVREWCADWWGQYPPHAQTNPVGPPNGVFKTVRSGSWADTPDKCRSARRIWMNPAAGHNFIGFRVVLEK